MRGRSRAALSDASVAAQNDFPSAHLGVRASSTAHIEWVLLYLYVARGGAVPFPPLLRRKAAHRDKVAKRLRPVARWLQVGESLRRFIRSIKAVELFRIVVHSHTSKLAAARMTELDFLHDLNTNVYSDRSHRAGVILWWIWSVG